MTFDSIRNDLRLAFRQYWRSPMFAALTVASLALGIGANSAMFAVVRGVLLQPLPYKAPDSLVMIWSDNTKAGERTNPVSPANIEAFRAAPSLEQVEALYSFLTPVQVRLGSEPEPALASQVTPDMFALLGRKPLIGQTFSGKDAPLAAVLSHQFWERRMGGDPAVIGRTLDITGAPAPVLILGVMPKDFTFPYGSMLWTTGFTRGTTVDMWLPVTRARDPRLVDASGQPNRSIHYFGVVGRLREGATIERARNDLSAIAAQRAKDYPDTNAGWGVTVRPLHEQTVGALRPALLLLLAGVGVVLLITCINVANVLLARAAGRRPRPRDPIRSRCVGASADPANAHRKCGAVVCRRDCRARRHGARDAWDSCGRADEPAAARRSLPGAARCSLRACSIRPHGFGRRSHPCSRRRQFAGAGHASRRHALNCLAGPTSHPGRPDRGGSRTRNDLDRLRRTAAPQLRLRPARRSRLQSRTASDDAGVGATALYRHTVPSYLLRVARKSSSRAAWRHRPRRHHTPAARQHEYDDLRRRRRTFRSARGNAGSRNAPGRLRLLRGDGDPGASRAGIHSRGHSECARRGDRQRGTRGPCLPR